MNAAHILPIIDLTAIESIAARNYIRVSVYDGVIIAWGDLPDSDILLPLAAIKEDDRRRLILVDHRGHDILMLYWDGEPPEEYSVGKTINTPHGKWAIVISQRANYKG